MMIPEKLKSGDEVRFISPSMSIKVLPPEIIKTAEDRIKELGLTLSYGKHVGESDMFKSSSIESRLKDLHEAFSDTNVKAILTLGGYNSNHLLKYIDYDLIQKNPKIFLGYSDITALQNAIYAKTGLVTYSGPDLPSFAEYEGSDYIIKYLKKMLFEDQPFEILPSEKWNDGTPIEDTKNRIFSKNDGFWIINQGEAKGKIFGGNLGTFRLLHGTEYMPPLKDSILFIEDIAYTIDSADAEEFDRTLQSLILQPDFDKVKGLVIGRFQTACKITFEKLKFIIQTKKELQNIPVIANADFGHTVPIFTFPIGGHAQLKASSNNVSLLISET